MQNKVKKAICGHVEINGKYWEAVKIEYANEEIGIKHINPSNLSKQNHLIGITSPLGKYKFYQEGTLEGYHCDSTVLSCIVSAEVMNILE